MPQLLDQFGNPVRPAELLKPQASAQMAGVRQAFAESFAAGLTPSRLAGILSQCDSGETAAFVTLAQEMEERDPHYFSVLGTRKRAVSGVEPRVEPAGEDAASKRIADAVRERIVEHDGFSDLVEDVMDALGKGFSVVEIDWKRSAREWWPERFDWVDPRFIRFDRETGREMRLIDEADPSEGVPLTPFGFIRHASRLKSGLAFRGGLARVAAFGWMCKAYTLKDWVAFVETYGLPLRLGRYDASATAKDQEALLRAVANIGSDAAAILPRSMEIEFTETKGGQGGDKVFENLARWVDEQVSKAVLGQTMTSDDGSSLAQADVHNEVRHDIAKADSRAVTATLNRDLVKAFVDLNFGVQADYPKLLIEIEEAEDTDMILQNVDRLAAQGLKFKGAELRAKLGFSDPEGDENAVIGGAAAPAPGPTPPPPAPEPVATNAAPSPFDDLDLLEREISDPWKEVVGPMTDPLDAAISGASSFEDAMERLEAAFPDMAPGRLVEVLVEGMVKARGLGDARDE